MTLAVEQTKNVQPWGISANIGFIVLFIIIYFTISALVLGVGTGIELADQNISPQAVESIDAEISRNLALDGDFNTINYIICALFLTPLLFHVAKKRASTNAKGYLGFNKLPSKANFIRFNLYLFGCLIFTAVCANLFNIESPQMMIDMYKTTDYPLIALLAVVIIAPIFEELIFRGFLFNGLQHSRLGVTGSIIVTSLLFVLIHAGQYDLSVLAMLIPLALMLGIARHRSGSIYLPIYLHFINNLVSSIEMYLLMN